MTDHHESRASAGLDVEAVLRMFLTGDGYIAECDIPHIVAALANQAQATEIEALWAEVAAWRKLSDRMEAVLAQRPAAPQQPAGRVHDLAARLVDELDGLVGESDGVSGLHLNGDVATWDELLPGGRFERLSSLDELRAALAAQQGGRTDG